MRLGARDDLTCGLVSGLTKLSALFADIVSLMGIQNLTSLVSLDLFGNTSITDISPLSGLTSLTFLTLSNNPDLSNVQPLLDNSGLVGDAVYRCCSSPQCSSDATATRRARKG